MHTRRSAASLCFVTIGCCLVIASGGCAAKPKAKPGLTVTGKIVKEGQPLPLDPARAAVAADYVQLSFQRLGENDAITFMNSTVVTNTAATWLEVSVEINSPIPVVATRYRAEATSSVGKLPLMGI